MKLISDCVKNLQILLSSEYYKSKNHSQKKLHFSNSIARFNKLHAKCLENLSLGDHGADDVGVGELRHRCLDFGIRATYSSFDFFLRVACVDIFACAVQAGVTETEAVRNCFISHFDIVGG